MNKEETLQITLSRKDFVIGTAIAFLMLSIFIKISSGLSLIVTFVPGVLFSLGVFTWLYAKKIPLPEKDILIPIYFITLSVQFLHFTEEFITGFQAQFPPLYGGETYSNEMFVRINMVSYFIFTISAVLAYFYKIRFFLFPMLFFIVYGAIGNAIAHACWGIILKSYFPGLVTSQVYWILGPLVLSKFIQNRKLLIAFIVLFSLVLCILLTVFSNPHI